MKGVFDSVASKYDLMNDVTSFGVHHCWKDYLVERIRPIPGQQLLDVAGGTGDIAVRFLKQAKINGLRLGIRSEQDTKVGAVTHLSRSLIHSSERMKSSTGTYRFIDNRAPIKINCFHESYRTSI